MRTPSFPLSNSSTTVGSTVVEIDGMGIVELVSEYHLPDGSFSGLEPRSKHRCPGYGLVPARRVAWGGASTGRLFLGCPLDMSASGVVWVDPLRPLRVALAFEDLHVEIERSWIKSHKFQRENMELAKKNRALKKKLKERDDMLNVWAVLFTGIVVCVVVVSVFT
ncbi:hypothetical protein D1007_13208 [Hordeum vulgare]|nr:hypothetical protein D1007_13208 [Hordeum vulgare]